ncbi:DinB family protein [Streptomyces sp. NPDC093510]|uniref:DinB family protein n=1 Tax=Streptomyces sp. NPDC093510 TaxID=3155199 RepID=UPI00341EE2FA
MTTLPDGRRIPPLTADEPAMLAGWLDLHRATLALKCAGVDDEQALRTSVEPSALSLFGLVQHLAEVERNWIQRVFAQRDVAPLYGDRSGFTLDRSRTFAEVLAVWEHEVAVNRKLCAGRSLDDTGRLGAEEAAVTGGEDVVSLRWIIVHLIEEYARHNGHADLLRERLDGVTGS